ncbi:MAG: ABC transporter permease [Cyanobacteria bacterium]|nr:ABC transporter permease [Cyanobacteriota bacterium]MDW8200680.1 FtsX-like permease family protein [Cyanobacteriota bacterium SKYGB_h_bin112]
MASIARKNLLEDIPRFLVAQVGIMFAVSLVTIQTGLQAGFTRSTSLLIDQSQADIWLTARNMEHLGLAMPMPYERRAQAAQVDGVAAAEAVIIRGSVWGQPAADRVSSVTIVGADPNGLLLAPLTVTQGNLSDLNQPYRVMVDKTSARSLNIRQVGDRGLLASLPAEVVGFTQGTQSIVFETLLITSLPTANAYAKSLLPTKSLTDIAIQPRPDDPPAIANTDTVSFLLIKAEAGTDLAALRQRLEDELDNVRAYTKADMATQTQRYWEQRSGIGFILGMGAVVGIVVGIIIVGQILYSSVSDHLKEFGTLKAMGASNWFIYSVIVEQALWMAILGYVPGMALCTGVAAWTAATQGITILITPASAAIVLGTTVLMCVGSAIFAIQKVTRVDPAIVFKS